MREQGRAYHAKTVAFCMPCIAGEKFANYKKISLNSAVVSVNRRANSLFFASKVRPLIALQSGAVTSFRRKT